MGSQFNLLSQDITSAHQSHPNYHQFGATHHQHTQPLPLKQAMQQLPQFLSPALTPLSSSSQQAPLPILNPPDSTFDLALNSTSRRKKRTVHQAVRADSGGGQQIRDQMMQMHSIIEGMGKRIEALERNSGSIIQWLQTYRHELENLDEFVRGSDISLGDDGLGISEDG